MAPRIQSSADLDLPKRIGRYEAFLQIGAGGMARVYLAAQRTHGVVELVVVKELRQAAIRDEDALVMFKDEAQIAMRLSHPNVVATRDVVVSSPDYYLVMEYLEGKSLLEVLQGIGRDRMPLEDHVWILTQVLAGLEHAHELRDGVGRALCVVHRDVSPSNVLLSYDGKVKLLDFGIAKASGSLSATHEGVVKGKLGYAAPEQCLGRPADPRSDIYAVGVMLWEAVAGRRRSQGETSQAVLQARILDSEPPLENVRPRAPLELVAVARRALAHDPDSRYATAREFREALELYLSWLPRPTGPEPLARLLAEHFEKDRKVVRAAIDAYCGSAASGFIRAVRPLPSLPPPPSMPPSSRRSRPSAPSSAPSLPPPLPPSLATSSLSSELTEDAVPVEETAEEDTSPIPVDDALLLMSKHDGVQPPPLANAPAATPPAELPNPFRPSRGKAWIAGGVGVIGAGLALAVVTGSRERPQENVAAVPAPIASAAPAAAQTAPPPSTVHVRVVVHPERAELRLDGLLLDARPYNGVQPRDGKEHELTATAEDYEPETRRLRFDQDVDLVLSLERTRGPGAPRSKTGRGGRTVVAAPSPPAESRPASPRAEPGMDLDVRPSSRVKHSIDEKDPYAP